jgi:hypothetical protein
MWTYHDNMKVTSTAGFDAATAGEFAFTWQIIEAEEI